MDIFKLLSRSTRLSDKSATVKKTNLPSSGTAANPQLYHDPVELRGKKRKLSDRQAEATRITISADELDFFAPKTEKKAKAAVRKTEEQDVQPTQLLDEEECRQILRSHRVKVMLLNGASKPKEKRSKKRKGEKPSKKEESRQLFPQPLQAFSELQSIYGTSRRLGENLASQAYKIPTEVQMTSLPLLLKPELAIGPSLEEDEATTRTGIDLLAVAPTGSGKTLAFLIPIINDMFQRRRDGQQDGGHILEAVVVAPTKELASQIVNEGRKLAHGTGIKVVEMRKGMKVVETDNVAATSEESSGDDEEEVSEAEKTTASATPSPPRAKADILVTTPLALLNALSKAPLPTVRNLVLDEADVLLDPLFREQTRDLWAACSNPELCVTLWSATMGSNIEALATEMIQQRRERLDIGRANTLIRLVVGLKDSAIPNISHKLTYTATEAGKLLALRQLLHPAASATDGGPALRPPFLVFTQTIPRAIALHSELLYDIPASAGGSTRLAVLHSDLSSTIRSSIMARFRSGEIWVLITTDILSRGVDFRGVNGVVNYDVPQSAATYVHRVGRTGRAGREGGVAVTLYTKEDIPYVRNVATVIAASEKAAGKEGSSEAGVQKWLLDALPKVSKKDRKELKTRGVESRRNVKAKETMKGRISSKSGYERKVENRKKGAIDGSRRRKLLEGDDDAATARVDDGEWGGIDS